MVSRACLPINLCSSLLWNSSCVLLSWNFSGESRCVPPQLYRHLVLPIKWQSSRGKSNQPLSLCLSLCIPVCVQHLSVCFWLTNQPPVSMPDCACRPDFISSFVSVQPDLPDVPALFPSMTCWLADWLTFGLIRVTYRRAAGTHKDTGARTNINAQAAYSACNWPEPLARTTNHPVISTTILWVCKTCSLISSTSCFGRTAVIPYF